MPAARCRVRGSLAWPHLQQQNPQDTDCEEKGCGRRRGQLYTGAAGSRAWPVLPPCFPCLLVAMACAVGGTAVARSTARAARAARAVAAHVPVVVLGSTAEGAVAAVAAVVAWPVVTANSVGTLRGRVYPPNSVLVVVHAEGRSRSSNAASDAAAAAVVLRPSDETVLS